MAGQQGPAFSSLVSADTDKRAHAPASIASVVVVRVTVVVRIGKVGTGGTSEANHYLFSICKILLVLSISAILPVLYSGQLFIYKLHIRH